MKKVLVILLVLAMAMSTVALVACGKVAVTFKEVEGGKTIATVEPVNGRVTPPETAKEGLAFAGWYELIDGKVDLDGTPVDFSKRAVEESMVVYGHWTDITVTFRHLSGKAIAVEKVVDGKVTAPPITAEDGFLFDGWYFAKTTVNPDGNSVFELTEKWDETAPTAVVELYANILDLKGTGAYHVAGGYVSGGPGWQPDVGDAANGMVYDSEKCVYTKTIVHNGGGFRILDSVPKAWGSAFNASHVNDITAADGVKLPEGYTLTLGEGDKDLFKNEGGGDQNIVLANTGYQFTIELTLSVGHKTLDLHITKVTELLDPVWALVGKGADVLGGKEWKDKTDDMAETAKMAVADGKGTITAVFSDGAEFKVVDGVVGWGSDSNNLTSVTVASGVTLPASAVATDVIKADGNIKVALAGHTVTAVITYDINAKTIAAEITAITPVA